MAGYRGGADRQDVADLLVGLAGGDPLHDFALARRQRRMSRLFPVALEDGALERLIGIDADDLERGACPLREIGLQPAWAEQGHGPRQVDDRDGEAVARGKFATLVQDGLFALAQVPAGPHVAPRIGIHGPAELGDDRVADDVILLDIALDVFPWPGVHENAFGGLAAG